MAPRPVTDDTPAHQAHSDTPASAAAPAGDDACSPRNLSFFLALGLLFLVELVGTPRARLAPPPAHPLGLSHLHTLRPAAALGPPPSSSPSSYGLGWHYLASAAELALAGDGAVLASVPAWVLAPARVYTAPSALASAGGEEGELSFWDAHALGLGTAQDGEDEYAYLNFFYGQRGGLILESGALDGMTYSVSRFFVFARGWRAVHVEGSPASYARLAVNRPEALNLHTALCNVSRTLHYAVNPNVPATSGFWEFIPSWIREGFYKGLDVDLARMPLVPCRPLGPLLELYGVAHINLWVLDVEGAEEEVLSSVDFTRLTVDVIVVELDGGNKEKDERCHALLLRAGFSFHAAIVRNRWYVREGFAPSAAGQSTYTQRQAALRGRGLASSPDSGT